MKKGAVNFIPIDELFKLQLNLGNTGGKAGMKWKGPHPAQPRAANVQENVSGDTATDAELTLEGDQCKMPVELNLPEELVSRLYAHQLQGVEWLHGLHHSGYVGGILGDDMGLGKTFQIVCFLTGLFRSDSAKRVLIVAPVSVLQTWHRELSEHMRPHVRRIQIETAGRDSTKKKRQRLLSDVFNSRYPAVVISSYQLISNMIDDFSQGQWDYVILDEGHCIKNPSTKLTKSMHCLPSLHRLILTGTPVQNHLSEFWALLDWCTGGGVFGSKRDFSERFEGPILAGRNPAATSHERAMAQHASKQLAQLTRPILLQRKKSDSGMDAVLQLPQKTELVVWVALSSHQRRIYENYLQTREVEMAVNRSQYPVEVINHLKTVCRHPFLIEASEAIKRRAKATTKVGAAGDGDDCENEDLEADVACLEHMLAAVNMDGGGSAGAATPNCGGAKRTLVDGSVWAVAERSPSTDELMRGSIKLQVTVKMSQALVAEGHRILIFSQSRLMCDILQRALCEVGLASCRIDGSITGKERQRIIDYFNTKKAAPPIALLTTRACGTGITLTGADRVIIHDPSWNPAEDKQAVDRAFRIGQTKDVVVYRLISAGSVEEKIYEKQVRMSNCCGNGIIMFIFVSSHIAFPTIPNSSRSGIQGRSTGSFRSSRKWRLGPLLLQRRDQETFYTCGRRSRVRCYGAIVGATGRETNLLGRVRTV